jgi:rubredoxin---NAD+ reductase
MSPITFIGTGLASYTVAREFRKLDKESPLRIITQDDGHFYSKPMLSNAFAQKKTPESLVTMPVTKMAEQLNAEIITHTTVTQIQPDQHLVSAGDKNFEYSQLVLAYGAEQIRIPLEGDAADKVLSVNDLNDYAQFRTALEGAKQVVVMGAGLIGCEFANDLQPAGFSVTLIDIAPNALGRLVPKEVAQAVQQGLQELGVTLHFEKGVKSVDAANKGYRLTLSDGTVLEADVVLSAIGLRPRLALAQAAGLSVNRGIVVDRHLKTSADDIYALGDCAEVEGLVLPFVMPLMSAARALAKTLAGQQTAVTYPAMPVVVKTPACPLVVSPPAMGLEGEWQIEANEKDVKALFYTKEQKLAGFVLTGAKVAEKNALTKELPPVLA